MKHAIATALEERRPWAYVFDVGIIVLIVAMIPFVVVGLLILALIECGRTALSWLEGMRG